MQLNSSITIERKRVDCSALGTLGAKGWQREEMLRKTSGKLIAGKVDVYYYSPTGKKIESKPQLARHLGESIDIGSFDFQTGKIVQHLLPPLPSISMYSGATTLNIGSGIMNAAASCSNTSIAANAGLKRKQSSTAAQEFSRAALRSDVSLVPPIRQTASIFKQPVTVVRNHENNKVKHDSKGAQEKPKQLFWEKRLERLRACHATGEEFDDIALPKGIRTVGPNVNEQTVLQSLATALHVLNAPVTGQTSTKTELTRNAPAFMNPDQPLMQAVLISEDDIRRQEDRVSVARRKLQDALIKV